MERHPGKTADTFRNLRERILDPANDRRFDLSVCRLTLSSLLSILSSSPFKRTEFLRAPVRVSFVIRTCIVGGAAGVREAGEKCRALGPGWRAMTEVDSPRFAVGPGSGASRVVIYTRYIPRARLGLLQGFRVTYVAT